MPAPADRPSLTAALRDARVRPDARGLMPLAEARARVRAVARFERGAAEERDGTVVLESDLLWAALLSLRDAFEFVEHANRLDWHFHVRGRENLAPLERYGIDILPWLEARVDDSGTLHDVPWCVQPCLLATRTRAAARLALRVQRVDPRLPCERSDPRTAPSQDYRSLDVPRAWLAAHVDPGTLWIAELAREGQERARELLADLESRAPGLASEVLAAHLSPREAPGWARELGLEVPHLPAIVAELLLESEPVELPAGPVWSVAELDLAADRYEVPDWEHGRQPVAAMRVTGYAHPDGDVLVLQALTSFSSAQSPAQRDILAYGPGAPRRHWCDPLVPQADVEAVWMPHYHYYDPLSSGLHLDGEYDERGIRDPRSARRRIVPRPGGPRRLEVHLGEERVSIEPGLPPCDPPPAFDSPEHLRLIEPSDVLIARLATQHRARVFLDADALAARIRLPGDAVCLFSFDEFEYPSLDELDRFADSLDFVAMVAALRRRRRIRRLPAAPNTYWSRWYPRLVEARLRLGEARDLWPWGEDAGGPSAPPADLVLRCGGDRPFARQLERGWPHLVELDHRGGPNAPESWSPTLEQLARGLDPRELETWPRQLANVYVRYLTAARAWPDGAALRSALARDGLIHPPEARRALESLFTPSGAPIMARAHALFLLEALVGGDVVVDAMLDLLRTAAASEAFEEFAWRLAFVWRRLPPRGRPASTSRQRIDGRAELEPRLHDAMATAPANLGRYLRLATDGRPEDVRDAGDLALVRTEPSVAADTLAGVSPESRGALDPQLLRVCGQEYVMWLHRHPERVERASEIERRWLTRVHVLRGAAAGGRG